MDKELNSLLESILLLLIRMFKGFVMGAWHGLRKVLRNKWYLTGIGITLVISVMCITEKAMIYRMIPGTIPEWLQHGIYLMLLAAPVIYLFLIGQTGQKIMTNALKISGLKPRMASIRNMPVVAKKVKRYCFFPVYDPAVGMALCQRTPGDCFGL